MKQVQTFLVFIMMMVAPSLSMIDKHGHHKDYHEDPKQWKSLKHLHTHKVDKSRVSDHARAQHEKKPVPKMTSSDKLGEGQKMDMLREAKDLHSGAEKGPDMSQADPAAVPPKAPEQTGSEL